MIRLVESGIIVDHAKLKNFNASVEVYCDRIKANFDQIDYSIEQTYDKLEDVEDFKSHEYNEVVNIGAKIIVATGIAVATTFVAAALLPEAACVAAVIATEAAVTAAGTAVVSGVKHYHNDSGVKEAAVEGSVDGVKAGVTSAVVAGGVTSGFNKGSNILKGAKGLDDEVTSTADAFLKKSEYTGELLGKIDDEEITAVTNGFNISSAQKSYVIKSAIIDSGTNTGKAVGISAAGNKIDEIEYNISNSELYEEVKQILDEMNIELEGEDIWQNI